MLKLELELDEHHTAKYYNIIIYYKILKNVQPHNLLARHNRNLPNKRPIKTPMV